MDLGSDLRSDLETDIGSDPRSDLGSDLGSDLVGPKRNYESMNMSVSESVNKSSAGDSSHLKKSSASYV